MNLLRAVLLGLTLSIPWSVSAAIHGSTDYNASVNIGSFSAIQNLGNGNLTHGAAITGFDVRASTTPGGTLVIFLQESDMFTRTETNSWLMTVPTVDGEHIYAVDLPQPFVPQPTQCYALYIYRTPSADTTMFASTDDVYVASHGGCHVPYDSDDINVGLQNRGVNTAGLIDYAIALRDDGNVAPPPPPIVPQGTTYGDIGYDFSFEASAAVGAYQNLGNGSFSEGNAVTGVDVRLGSVPGNFVYALIREYLPDGTGINDYQAVASIPSHEGEYVYHFDLQQFVPNPDRCYQLIYAQSLPTAYGTTLYGHSTDVYHASSSGCALGQASDDRAIYTQNPRLNVPGYVDYSFRIHTNGSTTTPPACTENCNSNVMFLPGLQASRLYIPNGGGGTDRLWEPNADNDVRQLFLKPDGTTVNEEVYVREKDILDEAFVPVVGLNFYKSFIETMDDLVDEGTIGEWTPIAYDWRLSLDDILQNGRQYNDKIVYSGSLSATTSPYILQELRRLAGTSRTGKVTLIAHSNGGLLAKRMMQLLGPEAEGLVDKIILVAVPQLGTPTAIPAAMHGYELPLVLNRIPTKATARTFASTSPAVYHLFPSAAYFSTVMDPVVSFGPTTADWAQRYGAHITSEAQLHEFLADSYMRTDAMTGEIDTPIQLSEPLLMQGEDLHASLDAWSPPAGVKLIQIAGWGVDKSVSGITYSEKNGKLRFEPKFTIDGDGTVVTPSALGSEADSLFVDLRKYNSDSPTANIITAMQYTHARILEVKDLLKNISEIISNKPISSSIYISDTLPMAENRRLQFELHSPLDIDVYDTEGRHTGVSTSTGQIVEELPGSYYAEFGESKYIFLPASTTQIILQGYGDGEFTFAVNELIGDTVVASSTFADIPTTPNTVVKISLEEGVETLSSMKIDTNGDGTVDHIVEPRLNDIAVLDVDAPVTTATISGSPGLNGWFTSDVTVAFETTDESPTNTFFSLDGLATTSASELQVTTEGSHVVYFFSRDSVGNVEEIKTIAVKIDKTSPEAVMSAGVGDRDLLVIGKDNLSAVTVYKAATSTTLTDEAGNKTVIAHQKTYSGKNLTYARINRIQYGTGAPIPLQSSFVYIWDTKGVLVSQTVMADANFAIQALYDKSKNKTSIVVLQKNKAVQSKTVAGLAIIKLTTNRGSVAYGW